MVVSLKDYKQLVLWTDYFNSSLSRSDGRRVPLDRSVKDPTVEELAEAARRFGFTPEASLSKHPRRMTVGSGYVNIPKKSDFTKSKVIIGVAKHLSNVRGERASGAKDQPKPKK
ncbi:MAG: signal recognition particle subunit SRP19/SEC65 family protein [Thaumarchaeota archaeon]|nr:signal recognition particle subunit SRP19/SEC65 family protein [Nitrososphaerota archaeon]